LAVFVLRLLFGAVVIRFFAVGCTTARGDRNPANPSGFQFVAFGDMPYHMPADFERLENLITEVNRDGPAFTVYVGDIKTGFHNCITDYF
jgi:hypothetical protein